MWNHERGASVQPVSSVGAIGVAEAEPASKAAGATHEATIKRDRASWRWF